MTLTVQLGPVSQSPGPCKDGRCSQTDRQTDAITGCSSTAPPGTLQQPSTTQDAAAAQYHLGRCSSPVPPRALQQPSTTQGTAAAQYHPGRCSSLAPPRTLQQPSTTQGTAAAQYHPGRCSSPAPPSSNIHPLSHRWGWWMSPLPSGAPGSGG